MARKNRITQAGFYHIINREVEYIITEKTFRSYMSFKTL